MSGQLELAVVGAGPYGLSLAAHLEARNVPYRIFGRPLQTWTDRMPRGMVLKSEPHDSNIGDPHGALTVRRYCAEAGLHYEDYCLPVSLETFLAYGRWFQEHAVSNVEEVDVSLVQQNGNGFVLQLETGEQLHARRVAVAAGLAGAANVPPLLAELPDGLVTHASAHATLEPFAGKRVAVIGAGQSALETAALLAECGAEPMLIARASTVFWAEKLELARPLHERVRAPISPLTGPNLKMWLYSRNIGKFRFYSEETRLRRGWKTLGPGGAWWLRERVDGKVPHLLGHEIVAAQADGGGVRLTLQAGDGRRELHVDHVIAGTGYTVDVDRLTFLAPELSARIRRVGTNPQLSAHYESSVPGLYFTGPAATGTFGPAMRFVYGSRFAARRLAGHRALVSRAPRLRPVAVADAGAEA